MRGAGTFEKFCDSLQLSGHVFLAELLRDEGMYSFHNFFLSDMIPDFILCE